MADEPRVYSAQEILSGQVAPSADVAAVLGPSGGAPAPAAAPAAAPVPLSGKTVRALNPRGDLVDVPVENWAQAQQLGFRQETPEQAAVREYVAENKGIKGTVNVALSQWANQTLMGIPELVQERTGDPLESAKWEALKKDHEIANAVGGVAGFGTSMLAGGPLFKGAAAAGSLAERAIIGGAEKAVATKLAAAAGEKVSQEVAASLVRKSLANAAKYGTEAAVLSAPQAATEAALGDPEQAGETVLYAVGGGALLGAASPLAKAAFDRASKAIRIDPASAAGKLEAYASEQAIKSHNPYKRFSDRLAEIPGGEEAAGRVIRDRGLVRGVNESFEELTARIAAEKNSVGAGIENVWKQMDEKGVTFDSADIARQLRSDVLAPIEGKVGFGGKERKVAAYIAEFEDKMVGGTAPSKAPKPKVRMTDVLEELSAKYPEANIPTNPHEIFHVKGKGAEIDAFLQSKEGAGLADLTEQRRAQAIADWETSRTRQVPAQGKRLTASDLVGVRRDLDTLIYGEKLPAPDQIDKELKQVRDVFKKTLDTQVKDVLGHDAKIELDGLNRDYRVLSILEKGTQSNIGREMTNRTNSLTDYLLGGAAQGTGAVIGGAIGGPVGAAAGAGAAQLVGMFGNKYLRQNYNALAVKGAEKLGLLFTEQTMRQAALEMDRLPEALQKMGGREAAAALPARTASAFGTYLGQEQSTASREEHFHALQDKLAEASANVEATTAQIAKVAGGLAAGGAPQTAEAYTRAHQRMLQYLHDTMPRDPMPPQPFAPKARFVPSARELAAWERRVEVAQNPFGVFQHLQQGTLAKEHVEALQAMWPSLYATMQQRIAMLAADPKAPALSTPARARLAQLFPTAMPDERGQLARLQQAHAEAEAEEKAKGMGGGGLQGLPDLQTSTQRILGR